ncbi:MAG: DUF6600 domain-containing protein [Thermodesulfovibrionales bacterium]
MMKLRSLMFALVMFLLPSVGAAADLGMLRVSLLEGEVQFSNEETGDWVPASVNMPLKEGDRLWVPERGRLEIMFRDGSSLRLDERSSLEVLTVEQDSLQFYLNEGYVYMNFRGGQGSVVQLDTPAIAIRTYERSTFMVEVQSDADTRIAVFKGSVYAESRSGRTRVAGGKSLRVEGDNTYANLTPLGPVDAWERWNRDRDSRVYDRRYSSRYLPEELESYSFDFDDNGKWIFSSEYGYVWTPTAHVSAGWAPYRNGRWIWVGSDYVWVGYEPWGWVPYHYGRWASIGSYGWCWIPPARGSVHWGPGYVGWVHESSYVAWVPLAPGEVYYGYGDYGPNSVNIGISFNFGNVRPRYRNAFVRNGYTAVHHDNFIRGRHADLQIRDNPFSREHAKFGRPQVSPERMVSRPVVRETAPFRQPPQQVRDVRVKELKSVRPFVREQNRSVFRPEIAPKTMPVKIIKEKAIRDPLRSEDLIRSRGIRSRETIRKPGTDEIKGSSKPFTRQPQVKQRPAASPIKRKAPVEKPSRSHEIKGSVKPVTKQPAPVRQLPAAPAAERKGSSEKQVEKKTEKPAMQDSERRDRGGSSPERAR